MTAGLAILNFGGPRSEAELEPFLRELFLDVLPGPSWLKGLLAGRIASARSRLVAPRYAAIGWSPLVDTTIAQRDAVLTALGDDALPTALGMMFSPPTMDDALDALLEQGVDRIVVLGLFPHYSLATAGSAYEMFHRALVARGLGQMPVHYAPAFFDRDPYIESLARTIRAGVEATPGEGPIHLLFSPHGLPLSFIRKGDPYPEQIRESVRRVIAHLDWKDPWHVGWQSRVGPTRWLAPSTPEVLERLAREGAQRVCMVPLSFVGEHIETLDEIDREYAHLAAELGIPAFGRAPALGLDASFVDCLAGLVREGLADFGRYTCVRCLVPQPDEHRRQSRCPTCRFTFPGFLRDAPSAP